ncbi:MAG: sensor histidine kinase [Acetivibrionales bacterium]|jgi:two-component system cell cycle sensor histidine kinase PleC
MDKYGEDDIKLYQEKIKRLESELAILSEQNNKLRTTGTKKNEFFVNIAHELKTPISVILGAIQLIEHKNSITNVEMKNPKQFEIIKLNCYRLLKLVNNILDISRIDSGCIMDRPENCNIVSLVEEIVLSASPYAEQKQLDLEFDTEEEEIITLVYADKIERIILNLLSNAIKFTPEGGKISVKLGRKCGNVFISVKDTGAGIPKAKEKDIFKKYYQLGSNRGKGESGSGIGLSLVKTLVDMHGGSIEVVSEENRGSEFIIQIPIKTYSENEADISGCSSKPSKINDILNIEFSDISSSSST